MQNTTPPTQQDRYRGCLLGLAAGDAVGTTVEFAAPGSFVPVTQMTGGGPFDLEPGQWTDDTAMALCMAESLLACQGFDAADQMQRYVRWWREGHLSCTGDCFDIGNTVRSALAHFEQTDDAFTGSTDPYSAGNGSLMRLCPVVLAFAHDPEKAIRLAGESSCTTHGAPACVDGCRYFAGLLLGALQGHPKEALLGTRFCPLAGYWQDHPLTPAIDAVAAGSFHTKKPPQIRGSGYVVASLEAALWAFAQGSDFRSCCLAAVNLGEDADTTAAICGQLAGAYYAVESIPSQWRKELAMRDTITTMADVLLAMASD